MQTFPRATLRVTTSVRANFLSVLQEKTYFFYFTHPLLQNTHINLSILHIYLIKYSFFLHFLLFHSLSSLAQTHPLSSSSTPTPNQQPFNKIRLLIHRSSTTTITTMTQSQSQQLWPTPPPCSINSPSSSTFPNRLLDQRGWSAFPTHSPPKLTDRTQSVVREISTEEEGEADRLCKWERVEMRERESCDESQREKKLIK